MHYAIEFRPSREVALRLWGLEIRWYAIFILTGAILAFLWARHQLKKDGKDPRMYDTFFIFVVPIAIVGARLWYVLGDLQDFVGKDFLYIINPASGGLAIQGGVIAGVLFGLIYFKKRYKEVPLSYHLDTIVPSVLIGQILGRWGNFINVEAYGTKTNLPWRMGIYDLGEYIEVHPTFLYESLACFIIFAILILLKNKRKFKGQIALTYLALYSLERSFVEGLRTDSLMLGNIRISQALSIIIFVISIITFLVVKPLKISINKNK